MPGDSTDVALKASSARPVAVQNAVLPVPGDAADVALERAAAAAPRRLDAQWGTEDNPVEVTSSYAERIVGVPDPYDDSIVWCAAHAEDCILYSDILLLKKRPHK